MTYKLFTDGGARGNPGPAAIGCVLMNEKDELIWVDSKYIGKATNNIAEYQALYHALKYFVKNYSKDSSKLKCHLDSELIVKQLNGEYKIKNLELKKIFEKIQDLIHNIRIEFVHVYREKNKHADKLVNISLDAANAESSNRLKDEI